MANEEMRRNWTDGAPAWVANEATFDAVFAPVTAAILTAADIRPGHRVLDVGCGTGTLLAAAVERGAEVTGIDISPAMAEAAARRVPAATVVAGDAQTLPLDGPFDRVVSRFGVMFFDDPVAAFTTIRSASTGTLTFACWRTHEENPMFTAGTSVLLDQVDPPELSGPGPTSLADPDRIRAVLAGWDAVSAQPLDFTLDYGSAGTDGVEERLATILGTSTGRYALERLGDRPDWPALLDEVRAELRRRYLVGGVVRIPAAVWLVTARA